MTEQASPWLPAGALASDRIQPQIAAMVAQWADHWFATARATISPAFQDDWPETGGETGWRSCLPAASLCLDPAGRAALAGAMLGTNIAQAPVQGADRTVIDHLASACADDLVRRAGRLAGGASTAVAKSPIELPGCSCWEISLGSGRRLLTLAFAAPAVVAIARQTVPVAPRPKLEPVAKAIGRQRVGLSADLGRCSLSLAELKALAPGDILVLESSPAGPVGLLVDGSSSPLRASIEAGHDQAMLTIIPGNHAHA